MPDLERALKGLECCLPPHDPDCDLCPYDSIDLRCRAKLRDDVMALLKAQEPIAPKPTTDDDWICGNCAESLVGYTTLDASGIVTYRFEYCPKCGRPVKWE